MNRYPTTEISFTSLFKWSFRLHYLTLRYSIACILLITLAKYASLFASAWFQNNYAELAVRCVFALFIIFFFSVALLATHRAFLDSAKPVGDAVGVIWRRSIPIYGTFIAYVVGSYLVFYVTQYLVVVIDKLVEVHATTPSIHGTTSIVTLALALAFVAMFFLSYPVSVIDEKPPLKAFYDAALLGEKNKLGILLLFGIFSAIFVLLLPSTIHEYLLSLYHLDAVYDFVVLCVMVPLFINLLLFLIHDSKQQLASD